MWNYIRVSVDLNHRRQCTREGGAWQDMGRARAGEFPRQQTLPLMLCGAVQHSLVLQSVWAEVPYRKQPVKKKEAVLYYRILVPLKNTLLYWLSTYLFSEHLFPILEFKNE